MCENNKKHLLSSTMTSSIIPLYGSSMICVQLHMSPQLSGLWVSLQIVSCGISLNCESGGDDGNWNIISLITAAVCMKLGPTAMTDKYMHC